MEIELSQIGQNIALTSSEASQRSLERPVDNSLAILKQDAGGDNVQENLTAKDQVLRTEADKEQEPDSDSFDLNQAVAEISDFVQTQNRDLAFSIDDKSRRQVVVVTDSESGDVIRQIPSEEALALAQRIKELQTDVGSAVGVLFNKQV